MSKRIYTNSKEIIIDTALKLIGEGGLKAYTVEAVIKESGLSKAGFFYNFKSKDELTIALAEKLHDKWSAQVLHYEAMDPNPVGRSLRAYVRSCGDYIKDKTLGKEIFNQALSELLFHNKEFSKTLGSYPKDNSPINRKQGLPPEQEMLVFMATEGLWYQNLLPTTQAVTENQKKKLIKTLIKLTEGPLDTLSFNTRS